jgi:hypothetical protein
MGLAHRRTPKIPSSTGTYFIYPGGMKDKAIQELKNNGIGMIEKNGDGIGLNTEYEKKWDFSLSLILKRITFKFFS